MFSHLIIFFPAPCYINVLELFCEINSFFIVNFTFALGKLKAVMYKNINNVVKCL